MAIDDRPGATGSDGSARAPGPPIATDGSRGPAGPGTLPALALMLNALTWGVSWWPFRELEARGLHPLWATMLIYALAVLAISLVSPGAWRTLWRTPSLWWLVLAAGTSNACFNWAVTVGDVVRVVLLFYLMPLWAVLLARLLLGEPFGATSLWRVALSLVGAAIVLWPADGGVPLPRTLAEWLGLLGGISFALNNVMLKREAGQPAAARALAMFLGGSAVAAALALALSLRGAMAWLPAAQPGWIAGALAMGAIFLAGNMALQFGASRLPASVTAVVMVTEVFFASISAVVLGAGRLTPALLLGGSLIVGAALLARRG